MLKYMSTSSVFKLTDLISTEVLQRIQDSFSETVKMAALTTEADGTPVTKGSNFSDYCMKYTRCSELGSSLCQECDRYGAEVTHMTGKFATYICHSGLIDFSAPITADKEMVGCFIGGQVLCEPPDEEYIRKRARELDIDEDEYWAAIQKVPIVDRDSVEKAASFLHTIADVMSDMAYGKYLAIKSNYELERAAKMQGDFLANMSHEIRTPMNAVIGFAEMALKEEMNDAARDYINQIKSSGNSLLTIINDILDYSKIESGKMELIPVEYEPLTMIREIADIIMTRLVNKEVELLLDVNPLIPRLLLGDTIRIRQILINLCNNATKFTNEGYVKIFMDFEPVDAETIAVTFSVTDTGIGIKPEDIEKIFNSFQQVDSRRNRNVEGTGLGLSICKNLLKLMDSELIVESEYGIGSTFSFTIKQPVVSDSPSIVVDNADNIYVAGAFENTDVAEDFINDCSKLGIKAVTFTEHTDKAGKIIRWSDSAKDAEDRYFFFDQSVFEPDMYRQFGVKSGITPVLIASAFSDLKYLSDYPELKYIRKPISVFNLGNLFNHISEETGYSTDSGDLYCFTAEDVNVLIVDDNMVNLSVAQGLLEPLKSSIDLATNGKDAINMCNSKKYDIIFMDHMMPELDGVDTTRIIRRTMPDYADVPIIALTANALSDAREMFMREGMNDFVAKPIEVRVLLDIFRRYVPKDKIKKTSLTETVAEENSAAASSSVSALVKKTKLSIADLDTTAAINMLGSEKLYMSVLKSYYDAIEFKHNTIKKHWQSRNWTDFSIEVHALKSASRQIGAMELGELAYMLEMAGKQEDEITIDTYTEKLLESYYSYKDKLAYLFDDNSKDDTEAKPVATMNDLRSLFGQMRVAADDLDMDEMESIVEKMEGFSYNELWLSNFKSLKEAVASMDVDRIISVIDSWR